MADTDCNQHLPEPPAGSQEYRDARNGSPGSGPVRPAAAQLRGPGRGPRCPGASRADQSPRRTASATRKDGFRIEAFRAVEDPGNKRVDAHQRGYGKIVSAPRGGDATPGAVARRQGAPLNMLTM